MALPGEEALSPFIFDVTASLSALQISVLEQV